MKLDILAFSLACALFRGLGLCVITWWIIALDGANDMLYCNQRGHATSIWRGYLCQPHVRAPHPYLRIFRPAGSISFVVGGHREILPLIKKTETCGIFRL